MSDFMDLYTAAASLGVTPRTFERHVERVNLKDQANPITKIKFAGDKKFYYSLDDVARVRSHMDSRSGLVRRPGDTQSPQLKAAA